VRGARLIGLIAATATAIALAVAGCGGAGHSAGSGHGGGGAGHGGGSGQSSTTPARTAAYPATFVARSTDTAAAGIAVFSTHSGQRLRRLTDSPRDIDPLLTRDRGWVYFVRVPHDPCPVQLERVPATGGDVQRLAPAGYPGGPVAISPDGRMLAYISTGARCRLDAAADTLVLVDLSTGQVHRIAATTWAIAWSPDDRTLAVVGPDPSTGRSVIKLVSQPMSANPAQLRAARSIPCPTAEPCAATSPTFDARGALFYTAMISHEPGNRCWLHPCHDWSYALVSDRSGGTRVLSTQRPGGDAVLGAGIVNADGSAMIYRLPFHGGYRVWRWSRAGNAAVPAPGAGAGQPVWR
jgi:hypothetical protein